MNTEQHNGTFFTEQALANQLKEENLRDWFAGMIVQGMAAGNEWNEIFVLNNSTCLAKAAQAAYAAADAMLAERNKLPKN